MTTIPKPPVLKVSLIQLLFLLPVSAGFFWFDIVVGYSILLGGLTQWVPQFWFTYQAFKHAGASQAQKVLSSMYRGEAGKIVFQVPDPPKKCGLGILLLHSLVAHRERVKGGFIGIHTDDA